MGNRVVYADILRILATFAVMIIHVSATNYADLDPNTYEWNILNIYDSLARWCVPMFAMLSGMFFLNPKKPLNLKKLFTKNIYRVALALVVWAFVYQVYKGILKHAIDGDFFKDTIKVILQGNTHYHLWFLYMILGLYLISPILRIFMQSAKRRDIEYFLMISFIFTSLLPTIDHFYPFHIFTPFFIQFEVNLVLGYTIYFILGYYLATYDLSKWTKIGLYILGALSLIFTIYGTRMLSLDKGAPDTFLYYYLRVNVFFVPVALFVFAKDFFRNTQFSETSLKVISILSTYSFGMYLVHDMFRTILMRFGIDNLMFNQILSVPMIAIIIFILSFLATAIVRKIPYFGKRIT
ncbi:acyltransferase [Cytobacillus sp. Hz8]|uniref:acyltransferase n=1 Tax=Cytobacillus sp. Hz8 TaxID=3347168 RepID=UPI0035DF2011